MNLSNVAGEMRVIVCGGRHLIDERLSSVLDEIHAATPITVLVNGGCKTGADGWARHWARMRGVTVETHEADWRQGRKAGPLRNRHMASLGANLCVAFPGGPGTRSMLDEARKVGIPTKTVNW